MLANLTVITKLTTFNLRVADGSLWLNLTFQMVWMHGPCIQDSIWYDDVNAWCLYIKLFFLLSILQSFVMCLSCIFISQSPWKYNLSAITIQCPATCFAVYFSFCYVRFFSDYPICFLLFLPPGTVSWSSSMSWRWRRSRFCRPSCSRAPSTSSKRSWRGCARLLVRMLKYTQTHKITESSEAVCASCIQMDINLCFHHDRKLQLKQYIGPTWIFFFS